MPKRSRSARVFEPPVHAIPRISTSPRSGAVSPSRISMVVVFPAPLGPSSPKHSRALTVRSSPATATTSAYRFASPAQRMGGAGGGGGGGGGGGTVRRAFSPPVAPRRASLRH